MNQISDEVIDFIEKTMKTWRVEFTAGGESLAQENIQICQNYRWKVRFTIKLSVNLKIKIDDNSQDY